MANTNVQFSTLNQPVQNTCSPENVYGGFDQTLFLGLSVASVAASVGWNEQVSDVTITLVNDPCPADSAKPKVYWDDELDMQTTTAADPGFIGESVPILGVPVYFRVGDFEFCGQVQNWEKNESSSGDVYTVKLNDGRGILDGAHLIVTDYAGGVGSQFNIFNVYGFMESFGGDCPATTINGAQFGTPAGGFGGSGINNNGMPASSIVSGFNVLANTIPRTSNQFSPYGRVVYKGTLGGNYGVIDADVLIGGLPYSEYYIDLSELPTVPSYYRVSGPSITVLEFVSRICQDAGYDYYWEMIPIKSNDLSSNGIGKFLKLRTVSRLVQQSFGAIQDFIDNSDGTISNSVGRELRQDTMASFLIGGDVESIYQAVQDVDPGLWDAAKVCDEEDDMILPYFGLDANQDVIVPCLDADDKWEFTVDTTDINASMTTIVLPATITITENELRVSEAGWDAWLEYEGSTHFTAAPTDIATALFGAGGPFAGAVARMAEIIADVVAGGEKPFPAELTSPRAALFKALIDDEAKIADLQSILEWLRTYADMYGTQFMVRVPYTCVTTDSESGKPVYSEQPQQDGWTDEANIIGLSTSGTPIEFFRNESGKVETMVRFDNLVNVNLSKLNVNDFVSDGVSLWMKAQVENEEWVYHDYSTGFGPRAVISIPQRITNHIAGEGNEVGGLLNEIARQAGMNLAERADFLDIFTREGADLLSILFPEQAVFPDAAAFGIHNNVLKYGPWTTVGLPGPVRIEHNSGLVPWEYNSTAAMHVAGQALAAEGVSNLFISETGSIQIPGYPTLPLGAEIGALAGGFFGGGTNLIENRSHATGDFDEELPNGDPYNIQYGFFVYGGSWSGLFGPNITGLSISVGSSGLTTSYSFRTFSPKAGRFAKLNADRLREQGRLRHNIQREARQRQLDLGKKILKKQVANREARLRNARDLGGGHRPPPASSHHILAGQSNTDSHAVSVSSKSVNSVMPDIGQGYASKHFMGLDSLLLPISTDNVISATSTNNYTRYSTAPVKTGAVDCTPVGGRIPINIDSRYLNPWSNPSASGDSGLTASRQDNSGAFAHNHSIAGRGLTLGNKSLHLRQTGSGHDWEYASAYRVMAFRGPMYLKQFGYDLDGKPVPNAADNESNAAMGTFVNNGLTDNFLDGFLRKPETWPAAPIDLRLDRDRGVWVSPPQKQNLYVELCDCLDTSGSVNAKILAGGTIWDADGAVIPLSQQYVDVGSYWEGNEANVWPSGARMYVTFDTYRNIYMPVMDQGLRLQTVTGSGELGEDVLDIDRFARVLRFGTGLTATQMTDEYGGCTDIIRIDVADSIKSGGGSSLSVDVTSYWLGTNSGNIIHRVPGTGTDAAQADTFWEANVTLTCGLVTDDAGHVVGAITYLGDWESPGNRHAQPSTTIWV